MHCKRAQSLVNRRPIRLLYDNNDVINDDDDDDDDDETNEQT